MHKLPTTTPEEQGVSSTKIEEFFNLIEERGLKLNSCIITKNDNVICRAFYKPYKEEFPHMMYSASKTFVATAIGFLESEGKLQLNDPYVKYFSDVIDYPICENMKQMRIIDMLTMQTGHTDEPYGFWQYESNLVERFLKSDVPLTPGTHYLYNSYATYMLSALVTKITGQRTRDYLNSRLFRQLDIDLPYWTVCKDGIDYGGTGLAIATEDMVKFGLLLINDGVYYGKRVLPQGWVSKASVAHSYKEDDAIDWNLGYGFQMWRCQHNFFRADGMYGQFIIAMPEHRAVVAITASESTDTQGILTTVWDTLLPALSEVVTKESHSNLSEKVLSLSANEHKSYNKSFDTTTLNKFIGIHKATFNDKPIQLEIRYDEVTLTAIIHFNGHIFKIPAQFNNWVYSENSLVMADFSTITTTFHTENDKLYLVICLCNTPYFLHLEFLNSDSFVSIKSEITPGYPPLEPLSEFYSLFL